MLKYVRMVTDAVYRFLVGGGFPAFTLCLLLFYVMLLVGLLLAPPGQTGLAAFADDFRIWCFGFDPATGRVEWSYVVAMTVPPMMLASILLLLWWEPLRGMFDRPRRLVAPAGAAALIVAAAAAGFASSGGGSVRGELPFPAEELRTRHRPPVVALTNQKGEAVELASLRGNVVMLTAVYASCPHTCPLVLQQAKRAVQAVELEEVSDLRVVAVTLDPSHDTPDVLAGLAGMHGLDAPLYNLVTGPPEEVESTLDAMGVARTRDPETGVIDHANLFLLVDREGRLAYRFSLGERQERWLTSALRILLREPAGAG